MRGSAIGRWALVLFLFASTACGGSSAPAAATRPSPSVPAYSYDCRAVAATDTASPTPGVSYATMILGNKFRDYRLYQPPTLDVTKPVPVVVVLHGSPIDASGIEGAIHFQAEASAAGFLAVYPDGCDQDWDPTHNSYDIVFIGKMLDRLESQFQIDRSRVYVTGVSAGGIMAYRVACDMADRIAAVASVAGSMYWDDCQPARPISILEMHGTLDANLPYDGGRSTYHGQRLPSVASVVQRWVGLDACPGQPVLTQAGITQTSSWNGCGGGSVVRLDTVVGGHHTWFGSAFDPVPGEPDSNSVVWSFLHQFQLPSAMADAATQSYVALVRGYWDGIQTADVVMGDTNLAARNCLGNASPGAATNISIIDPAVCRERAIALLAVHQKFLSDLGATPAPPRFSADDKVFRAQVPKGIADLKGMITACGTGSKQAVRDATVVYVNDMIPAVTSALDDVDPTVVHS
jgi:polyhydroxybutyrate depolymerase